MTSFAIDTIYTHTLKLTKRNKQLYVIGKNTKCPVNSIEEGWDLIEELRVNRAKKLR